MQTPGHDHDAPRAALELTLLNVSLNERSSTRDGPQSGYFGSCWNAAFGQERPLWLCRSSWTTGCVVVVFTGRWSSEHLFTSVPVQLTRTSSVVTLGHLPNSQAYFPISWIPWVGWDGGPKPIPYLHTLQGAPESLASAGAGKVITSLAGFLSSASKPCMSVSAF